jgi:hypothetical protein
MKRILITSLIIVLLVSVIFIFNGPIIIFFTKQQIKNVFKQSRVLIGDYSLKPFSELKFTDVRIERDNIYDFEIKEVNILYTPFSLFKRSIEKFYLKDMGIKINLPQENCSEFIRYLNLKPGVFLLNNLGVTNLNLNVRSMDLSTKADISFELSPLSQTIYNLDAAISSLETAGLVMENANLKVSQGQEGGYFYIKELRYDKARIEEIKAKPELKNKNLILNSLSAKLLSGEVQGDLSFSIDKDREFRIDLKFINLDLEKFVNDFNLNEKFQMSGKLNGSMIVSGAGLKIKSLSGDFSSTEPGGVMIIKDAKLLENISRSSQQPLDILMESFKDYHYNTGIMRLSKQKDNIVLDIALDSEAGKRNLNITLHTSN